MRRIFLHRSKIRNHNIFYCIFIFFGAGTTEKIKKPNQLSEYDEFQDNLCYRRWLTAQNLLLAKNFFAFPLTFAVIKSTFSWWNIFPTAINFYRHSAWNPLYRNRSEEDGKQKASSMSFQLAGEIAFIRLERNLWKMLSIVFGLKYSLQQLLTWRDVVNNKRCR